MLLANYTMKYPNPYIPTGKTGYYVTLQFSHENNGKQFKRSLKTSDKREATRRVKSMVDEFRTGGFVAPSRRDSIQTIGELRAMYKSGWEAGHIDITPQAFKDANNTFLRVLNATHTKEVLPPLTPVSEATIAKLDKMRIDDAFTPNLIPNYKAHRLASGMVGFSEDDDYKAYHLNLKRVKRGINSNLSRCLSIIGEKATHYFRSFHNFTPSEVPAIKECVKNKKLFKKDKIAKSSFKAPSQALYARLLKFINDQKEIDPDFWTTATCALSLGLRGKEVLHAEKSWFVQDADKPELSWFKLPMSKSSKARDVPMATSLVQELMRVTELPKKAGKRGANRHRDEKFIIGGEQVLFRTRDILAAKFDDLQNDDDDGRLHTLRKIFGSKILSRTRDIAYTSKLLGHANIQTTIDVYVDHDNTVEPTVVVDILQPSVAVVKEEKVA